MLARPANLDNERGAIAVLTVFFIAFVLIPVLVWLSYDVAGWRAHRRHIQLQADAAAFAAGDQFGECFADNSTTPPGPLPTAQADMEKQADNYVGIPGPDFLYNAQLPGGGSMARNYNSLSYPNPGGFTTNDGTDTRPSCASDMFDVKLSEDLSLFGLVPLPGIYAHAHARVTLKRIKGATGELPLAVPDTRPTSVTVTFVNMSGGSQTSIGTTALSDIGPDPTKIYEGVALEKWSGGVPLNVPPNTSIGVRIGLGNSFGTCWNVGGGNGYECYDADASNVVPLAVIRGYVVPDNATATKPWLGDLTETTSCTAAPGDPLFSDVDTSSTCSATLTGHADIKCPTGATQCAVTDSFGNSVSFLGKSGSQQVSFNYSYPLADGQEPAGLRWAIAPSTGKSPVCGKAGQIACIGTFAPTTTTPMGTSGPIHQQAYSADGNLDVSGPIKVLSISPCCSFPAGPAMPTVTVELVGSLLNAPVPSPTVALRFSGSASRSSTVNCDSTLPGPFNVVTYQVEHGCQTPYVINQTGICTSTNSPPSGTSLPWQCIPVATGSGGRTIYDALNTRFGVTGTCPVTVRNNWPTVNPGDPRTTQTLIADLTQLLNSQGAGNVPVTNFATFYITGWGFFHGHSKTLPGCPQEEAPPPGLDAKSNAGFTAIWGHFIEYNQPQDIPGNQNCGSPVITPCVLQLSQ